MAGTDPPTLLIDRYLTVLASNAEASQLSPGFTAGANLARHAYLDLDPHGARQGSFGDPAVVTAATTAIVGGLKLALDTYGEDERFRRLVGELSALSRDFSRAWADAVARFPRTVDFDLEHTHAGGLRLRCRCFRADRRPGEVLLRLEPRDEATRTKLQSLAQASPE